MEVAESSWYRNIWSLDIADMSWTEGTEAQADFLCSRLGLGRGSRVLDLACGFGRHSLALAERGCRTVGVDITKEYVDYAQSQARSRNLDASFILGDVRNCAFDGEFDAVISMGDGAIGYLENEAENLKIFDAVSRALKPGARHCMDIMNADYAAHHFPLKLWDAGEKCLTLSQFEWNAETNIMLYGQLDFRYGAPLEKPVIRRGNPTRLYSLSELKPIMQARSMQIEESFSDFNSAPSSADGIQLIVISRKNLNP
ncbi:MAG: class I SAM-dependent methyltransferase [Treponema sp.]|nr:class I SAM-dependent methyltransferase [Treponema sp.]